jgi:Raf kinase inhibitor-like YbhB/YbcL family protein
MNKALLPSLACFLFLSIPLMAAETPGTLKITSTAFADGKAIPPRFTCDGPNVSPPLEWSGIPAKTRALALLVDDPDAPKGDFTHWMVVNLTPDTTSLPENARAFPADARQGVNGFGKVGYGGPCPPKGKQHRYVFHIYALDAHISIAQPERTHFDLLVKRHSIGEATLTGTFQH